MARVRRAPQRDRHLLVRVHGEQLGQVLVLEDEPCRVGRHQDSELWLGDNGISRRHAAIVPEGDAYVIEDLDSANGTFVQGERVKRHRLQHGDIVQFGPSVVYRYSITDEDQVVMLRQLYEASVKDGLTGTYKRDYFDKRLSGEVSFARRHKTSVTLVMFDVDHFKRVNDTWGHPAGDAVLVEVAQRIGRDLRTEDVFARYGGEEFTIILRGIDLESTARVGERTRSSVESLTIQYDTHALRVTISVGCASLACCPEPTTEALIAVADRRLYAAKRGGRNRVVASG
jgi:two-component system cell cycle response regulator